jgi:Kyakuja-Dileera-Zisupton transposase
MKGVGHVDGKIMETLWSGMNKVLGAARSISKAHQQKTLDDYMRDSNWKKTVGIGEFFPPQDKVFTHIIILVPTLLTKLKRSQISLDSMRPAYDQLTQLYIQGKFPVESWRSSERLAMEKRGDYLKIFDINHQMAPTLAEITLQLTEVKDGLSDSKMVDWISDGIKAENNQLVLCLTFFLSSLRLISPRSRLRWEISKLPQKLIIIQRLKIACMRTHLGKKVRDFFQGSNSFFSSGGSQSQATQG